MLSLRDLDQTLQGVQFGLGLKGFTESASFGSGSGLYLRNVQVSVSTGALIDLEHVVQFLQRLNDLEQELQEFLD